MKQRDDKLPYPGLPQRDDLILYAVFLVCFVIIYAALQSNFRPDDIDDPWMLSYAYNYYNHGVIGDLCFGSPTGVLYFGKLKCFVVGPVLNLLGWTRTNGHLISLVFLMAALTIWYFILRKLKNGPAFALYFCSAALILEPFFTIGSSARSDALTFLLSTAALYLCLDQWYGTALLVAWVAFETHPMGIMAFIYFAAAFLSYPPPSFNDPGVRRAVLLKSAAGFVAGAALYYFLHRDSLASLISVSSSFTKGPESHGALFDYFFKAKYLRHLPELALFLVAITYYFWKKIYQKEKFTWISLLLNLLPIVFIQRPNFHYAVYFYPAFLLVTFRVAQERRLLRLLMVFLLLLLLPQYFFAYQKNHDINFQNAVQTLQDSVPKDGLPVIGNYYHWFAFYVRPFYGYAYEGDFRKLGLQNYYLIDDESYRSTDWPMKDWMQSEFKEEKLKELELNGEKVTVWRMIVKKDPSS